MLCVIAGKGLYKEVGTWDSMRRDLYSSGQAGTCYPAPSALPSLPAPTLALPLCRVWFFLAVIVTHPPAKQSREPQTLLRGRDWAWASSNRYCSPLSMAGQGAGLRHLPWVQWMRHCPMLDLLPVQLQNQCLHTALPCLCVLTPKRCKVLVERHLVWRSYRQDKCHGCKASSEQPEC